MMSKKMMGLLGAFLMLPMTQVWADEYADTVQIFRNAIESKELVDSAYGYAVFPNIGKGGIGIGGAFGEGRVYRQGQYVGNTSVTR